MCRVNVYARNFAVLLLVILSSLLCTSLAVAAACPWAWIQEQTRVLKQEPLESIRIIAEIDAFTKEDLPGRDCRAAVSQLRTAASGEVAASAAFLKVNLKGSAGVRAKEVRVSIDTAEVSRDAFVAGPGASVIPGSHDIVVEAPFDDDQQVTVVEVVLNGRPLKRLPGKDFLFRFSATAAQTHELDVRISLKPRRCYLLQVKPAFQAGVPNVPLILHGTGAGYRLQRGAHTLEAQRYALEVDTASLTGGDSLKTRATFENVDIERKKTKAGARYEFTLSCSAEKPQNGTLAVRVGDERFVGGASAPGLAEADEPACSGNKCGLPTLFWVGAGVGTAGLLTAAVAHFGVRQPAKGDADALFKNRDCGNRSASCDDATERRITSLYDDSDTGATWTVVGVATAGAGAVLAVGALLLLTDDEEPDLGALVELGPLLGAREFGLAAAGRF
ncbi:MAG: hypothetical protein RJA70_118 [Pseudomonadota bacterium]|jgi:hypothetical protein